MSRYVKRHKWQIMGVAAPLFVLFFLVAMGLSIFPGWNKDTYSRPGDSCSFGPSDTSCNRCNREFCTSTGGPPFCADECGNTSLTDPDNACPACPDFNGYPINDFAFGPPGCWTECSETLPPFGSFEEAVCAPSSTFCQDISGGTLPNACRSASCTTNSSFDFNNPSGCNYDLINPPPSTACLNCSDPPAGFDFCGNGVCEKAQEEDCDKCPEDCLLPGFTDACPLTSGSTIDSFCNPPSISFVSFGGPPYNIPFFNSDCEDGDLCTDNQCQGTDNPFTCAVTPKVCDLFADFCCPEGCTPSNDPDCLPPVDCPECGNNIVDGTDECDGSNAGCPDGHVCANDCKCISILKAICVGGGADLLGGWGDINPACDGCSLNKSAHFDPRQGLTGLLILGMAVGALGLFRRRVS